MKEIDHNILEENKKRKMPFNTLRKGVMVGLLGVTLGLGCLGLAGCTTGNNGSRWFCGVDTPTNQGQNGDYYLDTDDYILYNKREGQWRVVMTDFGKPGDDGSGAAGQEGKPGKDGSNILFGVDVPSDTQGKDGDMYLDKSNWDVYEKVEGAWSKSGNIKGDKGAEGSEGKPADDILSVTSEYHKDLTTNEEYYIFTIHFVSGAEKTVRVEIPETIIRIELVGDGVYSRYLVDETLPQVQIKCYRTDGTTEIVNVTEDMYVIDATHVKPDFTVAGDYNVKLSYQKCSVETTISVYNGVLAEDVLTKFEFALHSTLNSSDGALADNNKHRCSIASYLEIDKFDSISINSEYTMSICAYDENYKFIGNGKASGGNWLDGVTEFDLSTIYDWTEKSTTREYSDAKYFRVVFMKSNQNLKEEDMIDAGITLNYSSGEHSYTGYALHIGSNKCTTFTYDYSKVETISVSQDGAVFGNYLFSLTSTGSCNVYSLTDYSTIASFTLDKNDKISPHCNSVCFGSDYYQDGDEFPLLYVNLYNSSANIPGVCNVYRIQRNGNTFTNTLVQVIKIGFTGNVEYWPSSTNVRPYGNFLVDVDNKALYTYVMVDDDKVTRYFKFNIPDPNDGVYSSDYETKVVTLTIADILDQFEIDYNRYMQGGCYYDGRLYTLEGFTNDTVNPPKLRVIDVESKRQITVIDLYEAGITKEPEMIFINNSKLYIVGSGGDILKFDFI